MKPVTLQGGRVRLEPMSLEHVDGLAAVGLDPELWRITATNIANRDDMAVYVHAALALQKAGSALPFVTVLKAENRIIGSTRFANFDAPSRLQERLVRHG